ncbi:hypothetical protein [Erwinia tasmaniensis]|uniref:hypothetical protein n=1 Tax=Erwinia tasmaniensis TaxID=338565 RepID=UPI003A4D874F
MRRRFDRTCSLQMADIQGLGIASLILTLTRQLEDWDRRNRRDITSAGDHPDDRPL